MDNQGRYLQLQPTLLPKRQPEAADPRATETNQPQASPVERGEVDTETPGGSSGRRRRATQPTGSIRI